MVASSIAMTEYKGEDLSVRSRNAAFINKFEAKRKAMTSEQIEEFSSLVDTLCRNAYDADAKWFMDIANASGNKGRDDLGSWMSHFLVSYLTEPVFFANRVKSSGATLPS
jgi:hypothetical protein